ncbi:Deoxyribodipyrimidine photo-lyase [Seminavis robusta]|uniref:Deoxyribodipyrimidine photo-lyase n=1 Tax=Seminavis robusta TaxID=568900 RepID=A0A9N8DAA6_9STRA|nr:Deoxyribodipyrimidine photo-lyase [Seminavis robusta]|eukprot:Sro50_g029020.1 Deoxyribodipyrimidine photo-lyase (603) ;mRNA; r:58381-60189
MSTTTSSSSSLSFCLDSLPATLSQRIFRRNELPPNDNASFVLYVPTVVLRKRHNPAFALACHLANHYQVPVLVLAVVLDDAHLPNNHHSKPIVLTARRMAFCLEALQSACPQWQAHGAGVAIRLHGPQCRTPHHLTLARNAVAVVTDEPFVHPYRTLVSSLEKAVTSALFSVDGSTTVPPVQVLKRQQRDEQGNLIYTNVPQKAWKWLELSKAYRKEHVVGVVQKGHLEAPPLDKTLPPDFFLSTDDTSLSSLRDILPSDWKSLDTPAPGKRPWTVADLAGIASLKEWVLQSWPGVDTSVPPCAQTHGSHQAGMARWNQFRDHHLQDYATLRNTITHPHAVSRMSCYLNYGVVSIFDIVHDTWETKKIKGCSKGANKFEDEVVKWREVGYCHAFATPHYNLPAAVPTWASRWFATQQQQQQQQQQQPLVVAYSLETLETGATREEEWNAMQRYLVETGELHNNARMTWGKTMVHWQKHNHDLAQVLHQMVYVNDRYALDGLSPPSYAGLLWCFGWCDKPKNKQGAISEKPASRYRASADAFVRAKEVLLAGPQAEVMTPAQSPRKQRRSSEASKGKKSTSTTHGGSPTKKQKSIDSYFKAVG